MSRRIPEYNIDVTVDGIDNSLNEDFERVKIGKYYFIKLPNGTKLYFCKAISDKEHLQQPLFLTTGACSNFKNIYKM